MLDHSWIAPGSSGKTRISRSALASTSQIFLARGTPSEGYGNCHTVGWPAMVSSSVVSESSRQDSRAEQREHPRGPTSPTPAGPPL